MAADLSQKNFYQILGIEKDASKDQIRDAYRELARIYHPDSNFFSDIIPDAGPSAEEVQVFKLITEAYNTLSNDEKRVEYDNSLPKDLPTWEEGGDDWHLKQQDARIQKNTQSGTDVQQFAYGSFGKVKPATQSAFDENIVQDVRAVSEMINLRKGIWAKLRWLFFGR